MPKLRIGIICGGCSPEHMISFKSAKYIADTIDKSLFEVIILWIDQKGCWHVNDCITSSIFYCHKNNKKVSILLQNCPHQFTFYSNDVNNLLRIDVIFPIIHGTLGEDGALQGLLRIMNLPFVGSDILASSISMRKDISKRLLRDSGLSVTPFKTFLIHEKNSINFNDLVSNFGLPLFIKPVDQGSSIGVSKIINYKDFNQALITAFSFSRKIMIEPAIIGRELECAVLGNDKPEISVFGEIVFQNSNFYTYNDKYIRNNPQQIIIPAAMNSEINNKIRNAVLRVFQVLNCSGMARVDFFLTKKDQIIINEVNTLPGFTDNSMYLRLWEATGLKSRDLITKLIELALDLHYKNNQILSKISNNSDII